MLISLTPKCVKFIIYIVIKNCEKITLLNVANFHVLSVYLIPLHNIVWRDLSNTGVASVKYTEADVQYR